MKRSEMVEIVKHYLDLINTKSENTTEEMAEYIVGGCFETFNDIDYRWDEEL